MFGEALNFLRDLLFPLHCVTCAAEGEWWCADCRQNWFGAAVLACPVCHNKTPEGRHCARCRSTLSSVLGIASYKDPVLHQLIPAYKYYGARNLQTVWEYIFLLSAHQPSVKNWLEYWLTGAFLVSVPLHPRRLRERGFNQAKDLADIICIWAKENKIKLIRHDDLLSRVRYTSQQARLSGEKRRLNLQAAFASKTTDFLPEKVVLMDDVYTTGATMLACAQELKKAGVKQVAGLVLARG